MDIAHYTEIFDSCLEVLPEVRIEKVSLATPTAKGVVLFADENNNPIQLLQACSIRRTIRAKFFTQVEPGKKADLSQIVRKIYYRVCHNDFATGLWLYRCAKWIYPDSWQDVIKLYRPSFLKIDAVAKFPTFNVTASPAAKNEQLIVGPFANKGSAGFYKDVLVEAFSLCKAPQYLDNPAKSKSCPYLQMEACCGLCDGKISREDYLSIIHKAIEAAKYPSRLKQTLVEQMDVYSKSKQFEKAGEMKNLLNEFGKKQYQYRWCCDIAELSILHIDLAGKRKIKGQRKQQQFYSGFLIKAGWIYSLGDFEIAGVDAILKTAKAVKSLDISDKQLLSENFSLISYYLYRSKPSGAWLRFGDSLTAEKVANNRFFAL